MSEPSPEHAEAERRIKRARRAHDRAPVGKRAAARARLRAEVVGGLQAGLPQKRVVELSGYSRESVRVIARAAGIEAPPEQRAKGMRHQADAEG